MAKIGFENKKAQAKILNRFTPSTLINFISRNFWWNVIPLVAIMPNELCISLVNFPLYVQ